MHLLFLTDNFPPEVNAPASRTFEHAQHWVAAGHRVTVITCAPNFPAGKVYDGYRNWLWQREEMAGIEVIRVWSYIAANDGFARRIADYVSYMMMAIVAALFVRRVDLVVATSPQFFTAVAGWVVGGLKRRPWIFELRDIWPESIRAVGAMEQSRLLDWLERLELFLYRRAAAVVAVTHSFRRNLIERGIDPAKIHVVSNGADLTSYQPCAKDAALEQALGLQGKFVAGYIGTMGMAHGLDTLLDAAAQLQTEPDCGDIRILLLGNGAEKDALKDRAAREGIGNILFIDSVPKQDVSRYWSLLDISIIHLKRNPLFTTVIPSKLFEAMAMGIPVLHGVEGESADIVARYGVGTLFEPENADALAQHLRAWHADRAALASIAAKGPVAARDFDRQKLAGTMLDILIAHARR
jgi:glycosyltransferase involved in cell wall biosynthesis